MTDALAVQVVAVVAQVLFQHMVVVQEVRELQVKAVPAVLVIL
jgi:hypothetical protein